MAGGGYAGSDCYDAASGLTNRPCGNRAWNGWSTVGGGSANFASTTWATVGGGSGNTANGPWSSVAGGRYNFTNGLYSTVPGGDSNSALGNYSFAVGKGATIPASAPGSFLWSDSTGPATLPEGAHDQFIVAATNGIGL